MWLVADYGFNIVYLHMVYIATHLAPCSNCCTSHYLLIINQSNEDKH